MSKNCIPKDAWSRLRYRDFWGKPVSEWGVETWNSYYNKKNTTTSQSSLSSFCAELDVLINHGDRRTKAWKKAKSLRNESRKLDKRPYHPSENQASESENTSYKRQRRQENDEPPRISEDKMKTFTFDEEEPPMSSTSTMSYTEIIPNVHSGTSINENEQISSSSTQASHNLVMLEHPGPTLPCILNSGENFTNVWNKYLSKIDLHPLSVEHDCIVKTFQNSVLKSLCSKADWEQIRGKRLRLAEESLLERLKPVFQANENDKRSLLQNFARVWVALGENEIIMFEQYALLVIHIFISELSSKRNIISHPSTTEAMWSTVMSFVTGKAIRDGNMEYTWGEVELDSTATRKDGGRDILALPKVATGHKGDGTGLSNDGHECFVLEISFAPQDQDRRKTAEDLYKLLREMRDMIHTSKKKKRELGYKIPKDGLCVYGSQCYGYTQDLYEMEYIKPFYIVRKIGSINYSYDDITKLAFVLRMMWAFKERVASANQVWNNLKSRYEADDSLESSDDGDNYTQKSKQDVILNE